MLLGLLGCHCWTLLRPGEADTFQPVATGTAIEIAAFEVAAFEVAAFEVAAFEVAAFEVAGIRRAGLPLQAQPPLLRMKPRDRARVLAALAGLVILGFALVLLAWWGARFTRRYLRRPWPDQRRRQAPAVSEFDWANKPLYDVGDNEPDSDEPNSDRGNSA
jgi:hypothetical protein